MNTEHVSQHLTCQCQGLVLVLEEVRVLEPQLVKDRGFIVSLNVLNDDVNLTQS